MADPVGRFSLALPYLDGSTPRNTTLDGAPVWTALDQEYPHLVTSYRIDRGRAFELDVTDTGRATVSIADRDGILDPTNPSGPYYGKIEPLLQAAIARHDPVLDEWHTRFRGFVENYDYVFDPTQRVNRLELSLVDLFEVISSIEMHPGYFGLPPPKGSEGQIFFEDTSTPSTHNGMQLRIFQVLTDAGIPDVFYVVFSGNVDLHETIYSPGESALTAILEAVDAEFPAVANLYCDRFGRLCAHGRYARFDPEGTAATLDDPSRWDFRTWGVGDGAAVAINPTETAHIRRFAFNRGLSKVINRALASPIGILDKHVAAQLYQDDSTGGSIETYGIRGWTAQNLLTKAGVVDGTTDRQETRLFARYYVDNYKTPRNRITDIAFRSIQPGEAWSAANWKMLSRADIADAVEVTIGSPGGGGFTGGSFFIEGIHEDVKPLNPDYDDVTMSYDLSPRDYFSENPFPSDPG